MKKSKKLAVAALTGLMALGTLGASESFADDHGNSCKGNGCKDKTETNGCEGKDGSSGENSCKH